MSHDEFTKLFKYMEVFRHDVDKRFDAVDEEIRDLKLAVGSYCTGVARRPVGSQ